jgi:hypothetical protein
MLCPKCGAEIVDSHSVCPKCGHQLQVSPSSLITSAVPHITSLPISSNPPVAKSVTNQDSATPPSSLTPPKPSTAKNYYLHSFIALVILTLVIVSVYFSDKVPGFNPFEKKYQAKDLVVKNSITDLLSKISAYNTANSHYPWGGNPADGYSSLDIVSESWFSSLSVSTPSSKLILIQETGTTPIVHLCFLPQSQVNKTLARDNCFSGHFYLQYSNSICIKNREYLCFP